MTACFICSFFIIPLNISLYCFKIVFIESLEGEPKYEHNAGSENAGNADCEIKHCPECGKPMKYLAQIQWDTVLEGMEGNAYIEICKDCRIIAILHQQA